MIFYVFLDVLYLFINHFDYLFFDYLCLLPDLSKLLVLAYLQRVHLIVKIIHFYLQVFELLSLSLQLLDVLECLGQLTDATPHVGGEQSLDYRLSPFKAIFDGSLVPTFEIVELALLEAIPQPGVDLVYFFRYFLPLVHV